MSDDDTSLSERPETTEPLEEPPQKKASWPALLEASPWAGRFIAPESHRCSIPFAGDVPSFSTGDQTVNPWQPNAVEQTKERLAIIETELERRKAALEATTAQTATAMTELMAELERRKAALEATTAQTATAMTELMAELERREAALEAVTAQTATATAELKRREAALEVITAQTATATAELERREAALEAVTAQTAPLPEAPPLHNATGRSDGTRGHYRRPGQ